MIKIEFPADRPDIARALAKALHRIGYGDEEKALHDTTPPSDMQKVRSCPSAVAGQLEGEETDLRSDLEKEVDSDPKPSASTADAFTPSSEETEAEPTGTAPTAEPDLSAPSTSGAPVDTKGVAFDANYCGQAKDPYYATGKRSGQWKKRKGVDDADYDAWYTSQLGAGSPEPHAVPDTAAAFSAPAAQPEDTADPTTTGDFMGWVSELQAAGRLTQEHVNQAYAANGLGINALFPPNTEEQIAANIAKLYEALSHVAA